MTQVETLSSALAKLAFVEALPVITGLASGYGPGRSIAGETAAAVAPKGRVQRSENIARNAAVIGVPLGGLAAMALAHKYQLAPRLADFAAHHFPKGLISEPDSERELIRQLLPGAAAIGGSLAGGAATGGLVGGLQQLRGPHHQQVKSAGLAPSPMWSRIGGAASKRPVWMAQSGFTPTGFKTPAQRLSKSMDMGAFNSAKGLKPLDLGKMQQAAQSAVQGSQSAAAAGMANAIKMGSVMLAITKVATGQSIPVRSEKEDLETGDENEPQLAKAADDGGHGGFSTNQYSGVMNPPSMVYKSGIPPWQEPPVKTAGPPSEEKTAELYDVSDDPEVQAANAKWDRRAITGGLIGATAGGLGMGAVARKLPGARLGAAGIGAMGGGLLGASIGGLTTEGDRLQTIHDAQLRRHEQVESGQYTPRGTLLDDMNQELADNPHKYIVNEKHLKMASGITPLGRLNSAKAIGAPRTTAAPGPSIAQIAKPKGYGLPMSGAKKGNNII